MASALPNGHHTAAVSPPSNSHSVPRNIVIIGGGIIGVCTAYYLITDPCLPEETTVTLVEGTEIAAGASGHAGGFLAREEKWFTEKTLGISQLGYDLHKALAEEHDGANRWGYRALDTYNVTIDESATAQPSPVPWLPHSTSHELRGTTASTAQAMPNPFVKHLCSAFTSHPGGRGKVILSRAVGLDFSRSSPLPNGSHAASSASTPSSEFTPTQRERRVTGVHLQSPSNGHARQTIPADAVVLAAGPWLGKLATQLLGQDIGGELNVWGAQANSIILSTKEPLTAQAVFARINMGGAKDENEPEVYCRPDGTTYFCGTAGDDPLPDTADDIPICKTALKKLHAEARALAPVFRAENGATVVKEQACYLPKSGKDRPLVGRVRGVEGVWVGGGHDVWGIVQGPGTGLVLSEMLLGKSLSADVSLLAP